MEPSHDSLTWLLVEGLLPLFGAGVLYVLWGVALYIAANPQPKLTAFGFAWKEALDPLGWLYGGGILAVQSLVKTWTNGALITKIFFGLEVLACLVLLFAAMTQRGQNANWKPPTSLTASAAALMVAILAEGFLVYHGV